jgi:hypothetical protein
MSAMRGSPDLIALGQGRTRRRPLHIARDDRGRTAACKSASQS